MLLLKQSARPAHRHPAGRSLPRETGIRDPFPVSFQVAAVSSLLLRVLTFHFLVLPCSMWGLSSLTRDPTHDPRTGSHGALTTGLLGQSLHVFIF